MSCEKCLPIIDEYVCAELSPELARGVATHLAACGECAQTYAELLREQELYARYEREVEVTDALWRGVSARIKEEKSIASPQVTTSPRPVWQWPDLFHLTRLRIAGAACFAMLLFSLSIGLAAFIESGGDSPFPEIGSLAEAPLLLALPHTPTASQGFDALSTDRRAVLQKGSARRIHTNVDPASTVALSKARHTAANAFGRPSNVLPGETARRTDAEEPVMAAEQKYLAAIEIVSRDLHQRAKPSRPEVSARFAQAIEVIDRTIADTRQAVRERPDDLEAVQYMLSAYAKKVEVLREIADYR